MSYCEDLISNLMYLGKNIAKLEFMIQVEVLVKYSQFFIIISCIQHIVAFIAICEYGIDLR